MKRVFLVAIACAVLFDLWFSERMPWTAISVLALAFVYKIAKPFLRI